MLRHLQRANDADTLLDVNADLLLGHPRVLVLQHLKRGLGVSRQCGRPKDSGHLGLAVGLALQRGHLGRRIELAQAPVLDRRHARRERQRVTL